MTAGAWTLTYVRVKGKWRYLYRAVDSTGATIDFLLSAGIGPVRYLNNVLEQDHHCIHEIVESDLPILGRLRTPSFMLRSSRSIVFGLAVTTRPLPCLSVLIESPEDSPRHACGNMICLGTFRLF